MKLNPPWNILLGELKFYSVNNNDIICVVEQAVKRLAMQTYITNKIFKLIVNEKGAINNLFILGDFDVINNINELEIIGVNYRYD